MAEKKTSATPASEKNTPYHHGDLKSALLQAALAELADKGIEKFSLRGVAKRAGVSHAAPAHHFKDTRGLLTALATLGHQQFVAAQKRRQKRAEPDAASQIVAAGLGYVDFAMQNPSLFRLMFSSRQPDRDNPELSKYGNLSFLKLTEEVARVVGSNPNEDHEAMLDLVAIWTLVHGIADLMNSEQLGPMTEMPKQQRDATISAVIRRVLPI